MSTTLDASVAKRFDFIVKQNQTFDPLLILTNDAGAPINLSGSTAKLSVRHGGDCNSYCGCMFDLGFDVVHKQDFYATVGGAGSNELKFEGDIQLSPSNYRYDLLIQFADGEKKYIMTGMFKVKKSYTEID